MRRLLRWRVVEMQCGCKQMSVCDECLSQWMCRVVGRGEGGAPSYTRPPEGLFQDSRGFHGRCGYVV